MLYWQSASFKEISEIRRIELDGIRFLKEASVTFRWLCVETFGQYVKERAFAVSHLQVAVC